MRLFVLRDCNRILKLQLLKPINEWTQTGGRHNYRCSNVMLFDDPLATEEIIYCQQKKYSHERLRNGKYMTIACSCLQVLFQDQPEGNE